MEQRPLIERLARHIAAREPDRWQARLEDAATILAILKEPDSAMREAGDDRIWCAMIDAALRERWSLAGPAQQIEGEPAGADGADEEGEFSLPPEAVSDNAADWIHLQNSQEKSS